LEYPLDGYWLPKSIREQVLKSNPDIKYLSFAQGQPTEMGMPGVVTACWPVFRSGEWKEIVLALRENSRRVPEGEEYWERLLSALGEVGQRLSRPGNPLREVLLEALPGYTGFSKSMIGFSLHALDLMSPGRIQKAFLSNLNRNISHKWGQISGLPGWFQFHPCQRAWTKIGDWVALKKNAPLYGDKEPLNMILGYGAGNVPGTALMISLLAQSTILAGNQPPVVVIKNSRREPIFSPLILNALEEIDNDLFQNVAILVWDYDELDLQEWLLLQSDLVIAAASDETITKISHQIQGVAQKKLKTPPTNNNPRTIRLHAHGHKVSFSAISRDCLVRGLTDPDSNDPVIKIIALLAGLDSILWDQFGCLSSRIHFVEEGGEGYHTALDYASDLYDQMRLLSEFLPRGSFPRQRLNASFDKYKLLETTGLVKVLSKYQDDFLVALDRRPFDPNVFALMVNDCLGRVLIVKPVSDMMELPDQYLPSIPATNLQSLSVAFRTSGDGKWGNFLKFAEACGRRGITAIRTAGRGAFPQLAYSWDGLIPMDLIYNRPEGHFTSIEFSEPYPEIIRTYQTLKSIYTSQINQ